jgi:hypothetical protein
VPVQAGLVSSAVATAAGESTSAIGSPWHGRLPTATRGRVTGLRQKEVVLAWTPTEVSSWVLRSNGAGASWLRGGRAHP